MLAAELLLSGMFVISCARLHDDPEHPLLHLRMGERFGHHRHEHDGVPPEWQHKPHGAFRDPTCLVFSFVQKGQTGTDGNMNVFDHARASAFVAGDCF